MAFQGVHPAPDGRLLTVAGAAHAPWIEAPDLVVPAVGRFLDGDWPSGSERIAGRDVPSTPRVDPAAPSSIH